MNALHLSRTIKDAPFHCDASAQYIEAWGPCNISLRVSQEGAIYSNLFEAHIEDDTPVQAYTMLLDFVAETAIQAFLKNKLVYQSPDILAHRFLVGLEAKGVDLWEVGRRNAVETEQGVCHTHDFCDANEVMLDAGHSLGLFNEGLPESDAARDHGKQSGPRPTTGIHLEPWDGHAADA